MRHIFISLGVIGVLLTSGMVRAEQSVKVIALSPHLVELLFEIGAQENLIGVSAHSDFPKEAKQLPVVGDYLNLDVEKILLMQPDAVLAWRGGTPEPALQKLSQLGVTIMYFQPIELHDVATDIERLGKITGKVKKANKVATQYREKLNTLQQQYAAKEWIAGFYEIWPEPLTTINDKAWPARHLAVCKIRNVFADVEADYPQINVEQVLQRHVDIIIQPNSGSSAPKGYPWQKWFNVMNMTQEALVSPNADLLHRMTSRSLDELAELCSLADTVRERAH